jgi:hypothetical protein
MTDKIDFKHLVVDVIEDWFTRFDLKDFRIQREKTYFLNEGYHSEFLIYRKGLPEFIISLYDPAFKAIATYSLNTLHKKVDFTKVFKRVLKIYDQELSVRVPLPTLLKQLVLNPYKRPSHKKKMRVFPLEQAWESLAPEQKYLVVR